MLGAKTRRKDRSRQVPNEADRIPAKHLLTLQSATSEYQTAETQVEQLQLVIPPRIAQSRLHRSADAPRRFHGRSHFTRRLRRHGDGSAPLTGPAPGQLQWIPGCL
ncbi:type II restriction endonuclease [Pseudarthrobacter oxydans]|uniref:type II restriction endonuclease n=1 Tax=Pseudarthrobacter oxydans TaxID=1671 RepID=UPI0034508026